LPREEAWGQRSPSAQAVRGVVGAPSPRCGPPTPPAGASEDPLGHGCAISPLPDCPHLPPPEPARVKQCPSACPCSPHSVPLAVDALPSSVPISQSMFTLLSVGCRRSVVVGRSAFDGRLLLVVCLICCPSAGSDLWVLLVLLPSSPGPLLAPCPPLSCPRLGMTLARSP